jgi:hypothetical protein
VDDVTSNRTPDVTHVTKTPSAQCVFEFSGSIVYSREGLTPGIRTVFVYSPFALAGGSELHLIRRGVSPLIINYWFYQNIKKPRISGGPDIRYRDSTVATRKLVAGGDGSKCRR